MSPDPNIRIAILYQALEPPIIDGTQKPRKPGGYQDSGADIAFALQHERRLDVITPRIDPDPAQDEGWCYPDIEPSIIRVIKEGATHLWANTILFAEHPLQTSSRLELIEHGVKVIGQPPRFVDLFDDKDFVNEMLRQQPALRLPSAVTLRQLSDLGEAMIDRIGVLPLIAKPARGRGSYDVKLCKTRAELDDQCRYLLNESGTVMLEQYLAGEETTVTVMPPSDGKMDYWALPVVARFNHEDGVAPYNGTVAVTRNSGVVPAEQHDVDRMYAELTIQCIRVAQILRCTAPIRIDARRVAEDAGSPFAIFDVNMKPNMTGPGRLGRDDQASLTALAAQGLGWDYTRLLTCILETAVSLHDLRHAELSPEVLNAIHSRRASPA